MGGEGARRAEEGEPRLHRIGSNLLYKARLRLRDKFNRVDLRIFNVAGEGDLECSVGDFHRHGLDVGAIRSAGLYPNVEILELVSLLFVVCCYRAVIVMGNFSRMSSEAAPIRNS